MFQSIKNRFTGGSTSTSTSTISSKKDNGVPENASYSLFFNRLESNQVRRCCGLIAPKITNQAVFQLTDYQVDAVVSDATVTTVMTQQYKNDSTTPVEAKYEMPLPPYAAVNKFVVTYDGKVLFAKIKERQAAAEKYDDAIASGNQAFLVEKNSSGTFSTVIGNIPPGKEVTVSVTTVSEIGTHLEDLHFCLHRFMFPDKKFDFKLNLTVNLSSQIQSIAVDDWSSADKQITDNKATVKLSSKEGVKKNIIISIKPKADQEKPSYFIEKTETTPAEYAVGLNFYPTLTVTPEDVDQHSEFIFLIDCSGSMSGSQIQKAKLALEILMRSLTEKSKFNIWLFGSSHKSLFPTSQIYSDATLESASAYISKIDANLGGTELYAPLKAIFAQAYDPQYPRQLFILTDGEISDRDRTIDLAGKDSLTTRIFTLGIGSGVDRNLVVGLSKSCKGYYDFIDSNTEMENRVMKLMSIAMEPIISNIKVDWADLDVIQAPKVVRPIYSKERMIISGLVNSIPSNSSLIKNIVITADGPTGEKLTYEIAVDFSQAQSSGSSLQTLTAHLIIADLEKEEEKSRKTVSHKEQIVALGKKYNLVSNHTSFVVIAESETPIEETMKTVNVLQQKQQVELYDDDLLSGPIRRRAAPGGGGGRGGGMPQVLRKSSVTNSRSLSAKGGAISPMSSVSSSSSSSTIDSLMDDCFDDHDDDEEENASSGSSDDGGMLRSAPQQQSIAFSSPSKDKKMKKKSESKKEENL
ncbi:hypothetical protein PPL_00596 [Heterostelium album PN500]|uniref:Uncharacterized protein n=1 Tax=Heterostelium pallidum (strain ATCC 26659 / Pp 5 / PN500) TaxID=670386 RepID=D3AWW8_HETP5|nr:hypothetical protein PPL_00596 [Heterostelium album PN500]EFA86791.1 hypothetical protein PPL_00596 [Heterostelium album PN500]|eukprot:XP_020438895.1 hypothetical protein PPL_00596 [Heterostelium album PN500]